MTPDTVANGVRETQAEAVAYVVSRGASVDIDRAASDYISLNGDANTLRESLEAALSRRADSNNTGWPRSKRIREKHWLAARGRKATRLAAAPTQEPGDYLRGIADLL